MIESNKKPEPLTIEGIMEIMEEIDVGNSCNDCNDLHEYEAEDVCPYCEYSPMLHIKKGYLPISSMYSNLMRNIYRGITYERLEPSINQFKSLVSDVDITLLKNKFDRLVIGYMQPLIQDNQFVDFWKIYASL